jgi:hypothetical protein
VRTSSSVVVMIPSSFLLVVLIPSYQRTAPTGGGR